MKTRLLSFLAIATLLAACGGAAEPTLNTSPASSEQCPHGGTVVQIGDTADDGYEEVVLCNGAPGEAGDTGATGDTGQDADCAGASPVAFSASLEDRPRYRAMSPVELLIETDSEVILGVAGAQASEFSATADGYSASVEFTAQGLRDLLIVASDGCTITFETLSVDVSPAPYQKLGGGVAHHCGLRTDGSISCWGQELISQGSSSVNTNVLSAPEGNDFVDLSVSAFYSNCALRSNGAATCWGYNFESNGDYSFSPNRSFQFVSAGPSIHCGLTTDDTIYCFVEDDSIEITLDEIEPSLEGRTPVDLISTVFGGDIFVLLDDGSTIALPLSNPSDSFTIFGDLDISQLSVGFVTACGITNTSYFCAAIMDPDESTVVSADNAVGVTSSFFGGCFLLDDGSIDCLLEDEFDGDDIEPITDSLRDFPDETFVEISLGVTSLCGVTDLEEVLCWGSSHFGELDLSPALNPIQ